MSTSKHLDKICIAAISIAIVIAFVFVLIKPASTASAGVDMEYEGTIFDTSYVHSISIEMDDWDSFIESCESEEYSMCNITIDGTRYDNIAIRAKGNTSLTNVSSMGSQRYSFKIEFDHYQDGVTLDGLDKLCLNNLIQDNTMMKDYLVYTMMKDFGVDSPLCSYSYLTVNGSDWGLYLNVESIEDSFLERNYGLDYGNLYKPDSQSMGGGRGNGKGFDMDEFTANNTDDTSTDETSASSSETSVANGGGGQGMQGGGDMQTPPDASNMPSMSSGDSTTDQTMPDMSNMPSMPDNTDSSDSSESVQPGGDGQNTQPSGGMQGGDKGDMGGGQGGAGGGMGSDDVKLKYIDDNISSYSNIFNNAKTNITSEDENTLINSLKNLSNYENLEETVNTEEVIRYFVVHNFVDNGDSYTGSMIHNYYLYEDDGQLSMIPWDYNLAFGAFQSNDASSSVNASIDNPISGGDVDDRPMFGWIMSSDEYTSEYHQLFADFIKEWFSNGKLEKLIDQTAELIAPYVESDPTKFCTTEEFEEGVETLKEYVELRSEAVTNQLAGNDTEVDVGDLDLSLMGTMSTGQGGQGGAGGDIGGGQGGQMPTDGVAAPSGDGTAPSMPTNSSDNNQMPQGGMTPPGGSATDSATAQ